MTHSRLYALASLVLLALGCAFILMALGFALDQSWLRCVAFAISSLLTWRMAALLARCAIAASGRQ